MTKINENNTNNIDRRVFMVDKQPNKFKNFNKHTKSKPNYYNFGKYGYVLVNMVGNSREVTVIGSGTVNLQVNANGVTNTLVLKNVALVQEFSVNLASTGRLESQGIKILTENESDIT